MQLLLVLCARLGCAPHTPENPCVASIPLSTEATPFAGAGFRQFSLSRLPRQSTPSSPNTWASKGSTLRSTDSDTSEDRWLTVHFAPGGEHVNRTAREVRPPETHRVCAHIAQCAS